MEIKTVSAAQRLARAMAAGILLTMVFFYAIHVLGKWDVENYQPDSQTTATLLLHNKCAVFGNMHTLRPNTSVPVMDDKINNMKLTGSFMDFTDGHIGAMIILSLLSGGLIFALRYAMIKK